MAPSRSSRQPRHRDTRAQSPSSVAPASPTRGADTDSSIPAPRALYGNDWASQPFPSRGSFANNGIGSSPWRTRDVVAFNGYRDYYAELGYPEVLLYRDHYHLFKRGGIARRLVLAYPLAIWESGVNLIEDEDPNVDTPFELAVTELEKRLHWRATFQRADILARIGRYSCVLIGVRGSSNRGNGSGGNGIDGTSDLSTPLPHVSGPDDVIYLRPLSEISARIASWEIDPSNPRYGQPLTYNVSINTDIFDLPASVGISDPTLKDTQLVHWSRMIHITRGAVESAVYGTPILEAVWNLFFDMIKNVGGGSEAYWRNMYPPTVYNLDPEVTFKGDGNLSASQVEAAAKKEMQAQITQMEHSIRRSLVTRGVTPTQLHNGGSQSSFADNAATIMDHICGTAGIPQRIAMGSERGNQASSQDEKNWRTRVNEERELEAVPNVADFIGRLMGIGALPFSDRYNASWPVSDDLTEVDRAESAFKIARANLFMSQAGAGLIQTPAEIRENLWEMGPLDDKDAYPIDPNAPELDPSIDPAISPSPDITIMSANTRERVFMSSLSSDEPLPYPVLPDSRIVILGGPRSGKSSLARRYQSSGMHVYCGDARSTVKDLEPDSELLSYLPENLSWSDGSQYIADNWLSSPGPWVCEGVSLVRALRKLMHSNPEVASGIQVIYLRGYQVEPTPGQVTMAKGVATIWNEISGHFDSHIVIETGTVEVNMAARDKQESKRAMTSPLKTKSERKCRTKRVLSVPVEARNYLVFTRI